MPSTFDALLTDLTRDVARVQPQDALQFCANWFQSRLEEQRARTRTLLARHQRLIARELPLDHYRDVLVGDGGGGQGGQGGGGESSREGNFDYGPTSAVSPLSQDVPRPRSATRNRNSISPGPFGTLNVSGNALLGLAPDPVGGTASSPAQPPSFQINGQPVSPLTTTTSTTTGAGANYSTLDTPRFSNPAPFSDPHPFTNPHPFSSSSSSSPFSNPNPFPAEAGDGQEDWLQPVNSAIFARRTSVSAETIRLDGDEPYDPPPVYPKSPETLACIRAAIANSIAFTDLDEEQETGVLNAMQPREVAEDEVVIRQGDYGDYFYVVETGRLNCYVDQSKHNQRQQSSSHMYKNSLGKIGSISVQPTQQQGQGQGHQTTVVETEEGTPVQAEYHPEFGKKVAEYEARGSFGELALMYGHERAASVVAIERSLLWCLDRVTFRTIVVKAAHKRRTMYERFLGSVELLSSLSTQERSKIADALVSRVIQDGEAVVTQGEMGDTFFFVEDGEAIVTQKQVGEDGEEGEAMQVGHLRKGDYFGELSLLRLAPRAATVSAIRRADPAAPKLKVAALDARAFERLLGPLRGIMERRAGESYGGPYTFPSR